MTETFQIPLEAAEGYEAKFVPALFAKWTGHVLDAAGVAEGMRVLDVACGTGAVARDAAQRAGASGSVVGLDLNENMLVVARRVVPDVEFRAGDAAELPFESDSFDAIVCQAGMMFFPDPVAALREFARVCRPGGRVTVLVWAALDAQPGYRTILDVAARHAGAGALSLLDTYWNKGDLAKTTAMFGEAGLDVAATQTLTEPVSFDSIEDLVATEIEATPLADHIDAPTRRAALLADMRTALAPFVVAGGAAEIPLAAHILTARR